MLSEENTTNILQEKEVQHKKRGRKPGKNRKGYFYEKEEEAFVRYINSTDKSEKNEIFNTILLPAFTKMVESIIRRYALFTPSENFEDTFNDTLSFLITKVNNYNADKGCKGYSYCGTICKNYLVLKRSKYMKQRDKMCTCEEDQSYKKNLSETPHELLGYDLNTELISKMTERIEFMLCDKTRSKLTENEKSVGYALLELLNNWDELFQKIGSDKFNKTSVRFFIKEFTRLSTSEIREASKIYKEAYFSIKKNLLSE